MVVSTDSEDIARVARKYGAETPFLRPASLAGGKSRRWQWCGTPFRDRAGTDKRYEVVIDLDVTAPLRHVSDVENAYDLLMTRRPLTVFSVVNARKNPYYNVVEDDSEGFVHVVKEFGSPITCRQIAPPVYDMNASIHVYSREYLVDESNWHVCSDRSLPYVMEDLAAVDIDSEIDLSTWSSC